MKYYFLCAFGGLATVGADLAVKAYGRKTDRVRNGSVWFNAVLAVFSLAYYLLTGIFLEGGIGFSSQIIPYAVLRGVAYVTGSYCYLAAVSRGPLLPAVRGSRTSWMGRPTVRHLHGAILPLKLPQVLGGLRRPFGRTL
ncbi:MAG: hypothetical protein MJ078_01960 [Clostridia bacterium]|nr:hypothetical protein [Clostridia bacterium]